ncbi:MAG: hypothetical protein SOV50_05850 [Lentihominibacter sp.]|nr:hypothetical protein [Lentihominibacter sp.]
MLINRLSYGRRNAVMSIHLKDGMIEKTVEANSAEAETPAKDIQEEKVQADIVQKKSEQEDVI